MCTHTLPMADSGVLVTFLCFLVSILVLSSPQPCAALSKASPSLALRIFVTLGGLGRLG
jgi:hypothetical protein